MSAHARAEWRPRRGKILIGAALVLVGIPTALVGLLFAFFFAIFYFPNRTSAIPGTLIAAGAKREYLLYVPKSYDATKSMPLVISLHTAMSWPAAAMHISQWNAVADEQGFIVAYPAGTGGWSRSWEMTGSDLPSRMPDVIFITRLIDTLEAAYHIDKQRIYANGMSNGGGMAFVLSCTLAGRIAAVGMVSPGLYPDWNWCTEHRPVPVITFHGTADPIAPYKGGRSKFGDATFPGVADFMANWARRNRCKPEPLQAAIVADVTRHLYTDCADDAAVILYEIQGEGHQWPGGTPIAATWMVGPYSRSIDATRRMWAFFQAHPLPRQ